MKFTAPQLKLLNESDRELRRLERLEASGALDPSDRVALSRMRARVSGDPQLVNPSRELIRSLIADFESNRKSGWMITAETYPRIYWDSTERDFGMSAEDLLNKIYDNIYSKKQPSPMWSRANWDARIPAVIDLRAWQVRNGNVDTAAPIGSIIVAIYSDSEWEAATEWIREYTVPWN